MKIGLAIALVFGISACALGCGGGNGCKEATTDPVTFFNLAVGTTFSYSVGAVSQSGQVLVDRNDAEYANGADAYKLVYRENGFVVATRWYQPKVEGLFLLGEEVVEQTSSVTRHFVTPVKIVPYPLEPKCTFAPQSWSTTTDLKEGGSETHGYANQGKGDLTVPAGTFQAFHLVHTRIDSSGQTFIYDEYFVPSQGFVEFDYPENTSWQLNP